MGVGDPALEARELYRFFHSGDDDETFALRGVSIRVARGEIVAVVGPSGSGKSTLLSCLAGLDDPDGGRVLVDGARISRLSESERAAIRARSIGILLQSGNLLEHLSVEQNVEVPMRLSRRRTDVRALLASVGLEERAHARPSRLSGGELARAGLAVALANDPPILLADEPTGEVDATTESALLDLLRERARSGGAVLVVTHSAQLARAADRVLTLADGRIAS